MNSKAESLIRKIIREELEYYFEKLERRLTESSGVNIREEVKRPTPKPTPALRTELRKKYNNLLGSISENMDVGDPFGEVKASMGVTADDIPDAPHLKAVKSALERDYSSLFKRMDELKK